MGEPLPHGGQPVDVVLPDLRRCPSCRWPARCGCPRPDLKTAAAAWILAGGAHHTGFSQAVTAEHLEDFAEIAGVEFLLIDRDTQAGRVQERAALERGLLPPEKWVVIICLNVTIKVNLIRTCCWNWYTVIQQKIFTSLTCLTASARGRCTSRKTAGYGLMRPAFCAPGLFLQSPFWTIDYAFDPAAGQNLHLLIQDWAIERAYSLRGQSRIRAAVLVCQCIGRPTRTDERA